ncbi:ASK4 [Symbiodinium natans]|uniref:ASK4 protein n=1 Tax=Symbiodinium natans TaxID=878477 RepID=A0A812IGG4_9DINO|nr:ASK4 [Symbiodinium natans]
MAAERSRQMFESLKNGDFEATRRAAPGFNFREVGDYGTPLMAILAIDIWLPDEMDEVGFQLRVQAAEFCLARGADPLQHVPANCPYMVQFGERSVPFACNSARSLVSNLQALWQSMVPHILYGAETEEDAQLLIQEMTATGDRLRAFDQLFVVPSPRRKTPLLPVSSHGQMAYFSKLWSEILDDESSADVQVVAAHNVDLARPQVLAHAHAFVLSKASPVFAQKLRRQLQQPSPKQLEVHATAATVRAFLHLVYTGTFRESVWPEIPELVAVARLAAESQTWFVLPAMVQYMCCALSQYTFYYICKFALDFRQESLLHTCQNFVRDFKSMVPESEWVSWAALASEAEDVQQLVLQAVEPGRCEVRETL